MVAAAAFPAAALPTASPAAPPRAPTAAAAAFAGRALLLLLLMLIQHLLDQLFRRLNLTKKNRDDKRLSVAGGQANVLLSACVREMHTSLRASKPLNYPRSE